MVTHRFNPGDRVVLIDDSGIGDHHPCEHARNGDTATVISHENYFVKVEWHPPCMQDDGGYDPRRFQGYDPRRFQGEGPW